MKQNTKQKARPANDRTPAFAGAKALLTKPVEHIDITSFDARPIIDAMAHMSFTSRDLAKAAEIYNMMLADKKCSIILTLAGSTSAGGCMKLYADLVSFNMVDAIVATGASIVDMDFFEALGFRHYQGSPFIDDKVLRDNYIDRIYDTYIDEEQLQACDHTIAKIADALEPRPYSSREFIWEMGRWLTKNSKKKELAGAARLSKMTCRFSARLSPIPRPGFGLVVHQWRKNPKKHMTIDSIADFRELTDIKIKAGTTGLLMIGGGVPKNFAQDTVVCAEILGQGSRHA